MNEGPVGPPPDQTPPAPTHASWEIVPPPEEAPPPAPVDAPPYAPPPDYGVPPGYASPPPVYGPPPVMAARPPRSLGPIIAVVGVVVLLVVALVGYGVAGYAFANSRINSATDTYNTAVSHQNTITDEFNTFNTKITTISLSTVTTTQLTQSRAAYAQLVSQSQTAQPIVASDDAALAAAQAGLTDNSWLTVFSRSSLDRASAKIGHERNALAGAKTITGDLVQLGTFYQSFYDSLIDLDTLSTKAQASDLTGAATAVATLKTDIAKALELANAPGLPTEMKTFLTDFQTLAVDSGKLLNAVIAGDATTTNTDVTVVNADAAKLDGYDLDKMSTAIKAFYQPLIDSFNSEVAKANSM